MRNLLLSGVFGVFALTGAAMAADMPSYPAPAEAVVDPGNDWTGLYVGINGGWNWAETDEASALPIGDTDGFLIGGHVGYNWNWNSLLIGVEGDGNYVDNDDVAFEQNYLASFRGRVGFGWDRFLVYGTGGVGFTGIDIDGVIAGGEDSADYVGWVAGGGVEFMLTQNVSLGVEYLHYEFGDESLDDALGDDFDLDLSNDVVRGRLSVKFDSLFN